MGGQDARLKWTKKAELRLQEELKYIARKKCDSAIANFAQCAEENGLLVIFRCNQQNKKMNECLGKYTNPQSFEDYKRSREEELMGKSPQERQAAMSD